MNRISFFKVLMVLVLCVGAIGFYRGWFVLSSHPGVAGNNTREISLTVDQDKAAADAKAVDAKARELGRKALDRPANSKAP